MQRFYTTLLLLLPCLFFQNNLLAQKAQKVELTSTWVRAPLQLPKGKAKIDVSGLLPGNTYAVVAIGMVIGQKASFEISPDDNAGISRGSASTARFVPQFNSPHSLTTGLVTNGGSTYYVKWLDRELRLAEQPLGSCSGLALPSVGSLSLPSASDVQDPSDATNTTVYIGAKPTLTSAPAVIHGVVQ